MDERLQLTFSLLSLGLVVVAAYLAFRITRPGDGALPVAPIIQEAPTATVDVWLADLPQPDGDSRGSGDVSAIEGEGRVPQVQFLFKPRQGARERDDYLDRSLSRRLGAPDDSYRFFELVVVNLDPELPFVIDAPFLPIAGRGREGAAPGLSPAAIYERGQGMVTTADVTAARALGLREGPYRVPPRAAAHYLVAFEGAVEESSWTALEMNLPAGTVAFRRAELSRERLDEFMLEPRELHDAGSEFHARHTDRGPAGAGTQD